MVIGRPKRQVMTFNLKLMLRELVFGAGNFQQLFQLFMLICAYAGRIAQAQGEGKRSFPPPP